WRKAKSIAASYAKSKYNGKFLGLWGWVFISSAAQPGTAAQIDPDAYTADGLGFQVDTFAPDYYWGPDYSANRNLYTGYQNQPAFSNFAPTSTLPSSYTWKQVADARWADQGTLYWWSDYMDNHTGSGLGGGWSFNDLKNYMLGGRASGAPIVPVQHPEYSILGNNNDSSIFADPS